MNKNSNFKISCSSFKRSFELFFKLIFKSERTWVFNILLPFSIIFAIFYSFSSFSVAHQILPPQLLSLFLVPSIFSTLYVVMNYNEWKNTYILQRIKFTSVSKNNIVCSLFIISLILSVVSTIFSIFLIYLFSTFMTRMQFSNLGNLFFWNWFYFILSVFLAVLCFLLISLLISNLINKKAIANGILILYFILVLILSDILIPSFIGVRSSILNYLNYINIFKYISWFNLLTASFSFVDYTGGIEQVVQSEGEKYYVFIKSIYLGIFIPLLFVVPIYVLNLKVFKWKGQ